MRMIQNNSQYTSDHISKYHPYIAQKLYHLDRALKIITNFLSQNCFEMLKFHIGSLFIFITIVIIDSDVSFILDN